MAICQQLSRRVDWKKFIEAKVSCHEINFWMSQLQTNGIQFILH